MDNIDHNRGVVTVTVLTREEEFSECLPPNPPGLGFLDALNCVI